MGEDVSLEAVRQLIPHGGPSVRTCHPLPRVAAAGGRLGTGTQLGTGNTAVDTGGVNGDTAMDVGHSWGHGWVQGTRLGGTQLWVGVTSGDTAGAEAQLWIQDRAGGTRLDTGRSRHRGQLEDMAAIKGHN